MSMKSRRFGFVAFWDEVAWVAGVTTHNNVGEGQTLDAAIKNLRLQLEMEAMWAAEDNRIPFVIDHDGMKVMETFSQKKGRSVPQARREPKKDVRYTGTLEVRWDPTNKLRLLKRP